MSRVVTYQAVLLAIFKTSLERPPIKTRVFALAIEAVSFPTTHILAVAHTSVPMASRAHIANAHQVSEKLTASPMPW